jgi:hypothetical protein
MSEHSAAASGRHTPPVGVVLAVIVAVQALLMLWFAWPAQKAEPRDLPVVVAGQPQAAEALAAKLGAAREGAFEVSTVADAAAADEALTDRTAYGAFIVGAETAGLSPSEATSGVEVHVASAASPAVSTALSQLAASLGQPGVKVVDVVPTSADDPRGAGFAGSFLPLILTSIGAGVVTALLAGSRVVRVAAVVGYSASAGLLAAGLMHWTGVLAGSYLGAATAIALLTGAIAATVAGLYALIGRAGIAVGAMLVFLIGNPLSGLATAPELLPQPWGEVGQFLPVGAGATLIRSAAYFDWAGGTRSAIVLASYVLVGLILVATAGVRRRHPAPTEPTPDLVAA